GVIAEVKAELHIPAAQHPAAAAVAPDTGAQPSSESAEFDRGLVLHQQGKLAEAERIYRDVLHRQPARFDALHLLAGIALQIGRTERAIELIGKAVALNASAPNVHNNLGNALKQAGRYDAALASYDRVIALAPDFAEAHNNRGLVLLDLGRPNDALES